MWPFGPNKKVSKKKSFVKDVTRRGDFLSIYSIGFFGPFTTSPNGRYTLGWCDANWESGRGGFRDKGEGSYILLDRDEVILKGQMQRPNDGRIGDNGTVVLNDWMFGEGLKGTFYAIDWQGNVLVKKSFRANLFNNGLSSGGKYAVCQTCNSDNEDGNMLCLFDLCARNILWAKPPESGCADSYEFDVNQGLLYLVYRDGSKYAYNFLGEFVDAERLQKEIIEGASGFELCAIVRERFKSLDKGVDLETSEEILSLLEQALRRTPENNADDRAMIYRTVGEVFEALGKKLEAIEHYERALKLNPKVGIKRRLDALKRNV